MLDHDAIQHALTWRYATKQFDPSKKIDEAEVDGLLEAARLAPSSYGLQPWRFVVVRDPETRKQLRQIAWNQSQVTDASHLVVLCRLASLEEDHLTTYTDSVESVRGLPKGGASQLLAMLQNLRNSKPEAELLTWMDRQVYIALGTLLTTAAIRGVDACPMEGFDPNAADQILALRDKGLHAVVMVALGRRSEMDTYARLKKVRFPKAEVVLEA